MATKTTVPTVPLSKVAAELAEKTPIAVAAELSVCRCMASASY